jgi:hypothetical protein
VCVCVCVHQTRMVGNYRCAWVLSEPSLAQWQGQVDRGVLCGGHGILPRTMCTVVTSNKSLEMVATCGPSPLVGRGKCRHREKCMAMQGAAARPARVLCIALVGRMSCLHGQHAVCGPLYLDQPSLKCSSSPEAGVTQWHRVNRRGGHGKRKPPAAGQYAHGAVVRSCQLKSWHCKT